MLLKLGVDISRLNRPIRSILYRIDNIYKSYNDELVITSTYESSHSPSSLHYSNDAIDIRLPKDGMNIEMVQRIRNAIGNNFDVVLETTHIHIEYDKGTK